MAHSHEPKTECYHRLEDTDEGLQSLILANARFIFTLRPGSDPLGLKAGTWSQSIEILIRLLGNSGYKAVLVQGQPESARTVAESRTMGSITEALESLLQLTAELLRDEQPRWKSKQVQCGNGTVADYFLN